MIRARMVIAVVAVVGAGLAACSDRPNDLDTYYDDRQAAPEKAAASPTKPATQGQPDPDPAEKQPSEADLAKLDDAVKAAVLSDEDVAAEGVSPVEDAAVVPSRSCLAAIPVGLVAKLRAKAGWEYPTGSTLDQLVTGYPGRSAADVLRTRVSCGGEPLEVDPGTAVAAHAAWCEKTTCAVVVADGNVLSAVQVTAGERERAAEAVIRLAPITAARLAGDEGGDAGGAGEGGSGTEQ